MQNKKLDKMRNSFYVRVYDDDVLKSINELVETKQFDSINDLLCRAIAIGTEQIYSDFGKKRALSAPIDAVTPGTEKINELLYRQKNLELTINDIFVMLSVIENMQTTLYNVEAAKSSGEAISAELMDNGYFGSLPERYQEIKDKLIKRIEKKKYKE